MAKRAFDPEQHPRWDDGPGGERDGRFKPKTAASAAAVQESERVATRHAAARKRGTYIDDTLNYTEGVREVVEAVAPGWATMQLGTDNPLIDDGLEEVVRSVAAGVRGARVDSVQSRHGLEAEDGVAAYVELGTGNIIFDEWWAAKLHNEEPSVARVRAAMLVVHEVLHTASGGSGGSIEEGVVETLARWITHQRMSKNYGPHWMARIGIQVGQEDSFFSVYPQETKVTRALAHFAGPQVVSQLLRMTSSQREQAIGKLVLERLRAVARKLKLPKATKAVLASTRKAPALLGRVAKPARPYVLGLSGLMESKHALRLFTGRSVTAEQFEEIMGKVGVGLFDRDKFIKRYRRGRRED